MKIFISLKVPRGNIELIKLADVISQSVRNAGHEPFIASQEIADQGLTDPKDFMPFVRQHAETSELMVVLYHPELRGGLIELGIAFALGIPVWLCHETRERVSSSALGCADLTITYKTLDDLNNQLTANLCDLTK